MFVVIYLKGVGLYVIKIFKNVFSFFDCWLVELFFFKNDLNFVVNKLNIVLLLVYFKCFMYV